MYHRNTIGFKNNYEIARIIAQETPRPFGPSPRPHPFFDITSVWRLGELLKLEITMVHSPGLPFACKSIVRTRIRICITRKSRTVSVQPCEVLNLIIALTAVHFWIRRRKYTTIT